MSPSQDAQIRGRHLLETLDAASAASSRPRIILRRWPTFENRG